MLTYLSSVLASMNFLFSFSLRTSWFLIWQVTFNWNLYILGIMLWYSRSYLNLLFYLAASDTVQAKVDTLSSLPGRGESPGFPHHLLWPRGRQDTTLSGDKIPNSLFSLSLTTLQWVEGKEGQLSPYSLPRMDLDSSLGLWWQILELGHNFFGGVWL